MKNEKQIKSGQFKKCSSRSGKRILSLQVKLINFKWIIDNEL